MLTYLTNKFSTKDARSGAGAAALSNIPTPRLNLTTSSATAPSSFRLDGCSVARAVQMAVHHRRGPGLIHVLLDQQGPRLMRTIINASTAHQVLATIGIWTCVFIGSVIFQRWTILIMTRAGETVQFAFRRKLFDHLKSFR